MKRILFVDDDADLLSALRARFHRRRTEWQMSFADSGAAALEQMETQRADLVVSDVRMPGMDGAQLLAKLQARWPETARIVMSGYADQAQVLQLVSLAHQYVNKPCDAQQLEDIIERCLRLQDRLPQERLRAAAGRIGKLPVAPETHRKLQTVLNAPNAGLLQATEIALADAAMAAKILHVVNSAFFRLARPTTRIQDAVTYLGLGSLRALIMSSEIFSPHTMNADRAAEPPRLELHAGRIAAARLGLNPAPLSDDVLLAELAHRIGYAALLQECPLELNHALSLAEKENLAFDVAERRVFGATHADLGAYLLGLWGVPIDAVAAQLDSLPHEMHGAQ